MSKKWIAPSDQQVHDLLKQLEDAWNTDGTVEVRAEALTWCYRRDAKLNEFAGPVAIFDFYVNSVETDVANITMGEPEMKSSSPPARKSIFTQFMPEHRKVHATWIGYARKAYIDSEGTQYAVGDLFKEGWTTLYATYGVHIDRTLVWRERTM